MDAKIKPFAVYEERLVPPWATAKVPEVIFDASRLGMDEVVRMGMSAARMALNDGVEVEPSAGEARNERPPWLMNVMFTFPLEVIAELVANTFAGAVTPTEVTVPAEDVAHAGAPETTVKTWPGAPTAERPVPPWATPKTPVMEEVGIEGRRAILIVPVVIWVPLIVMFARVTAGKVPDVICEASRFGISDAANALKVGTPDVEVGAANTVATVCVAKVAVVVPPAPVIGEPDTLNMFGRTVATEDKVPAVEVAQVALPVASEVRILFSPGVPLVIFRAPFTVIASERESPNTIDPFICTGPVAVKAVVVTPEATTTEVAFTAPANIEPKGFDDEPTPLVPATSGWITTFTFVRSMMDEVALHVGTPPTRVKTWPVVPAAT